MSPAISRYLTIRSAVPGGTTSKSSCPDPIVLDIAGQHQGRPARLATAPRDGARPRKHLAHSPERDKLPFTAWPVSGDESGQRRVERSAGLLGTLGEARTHPAEHPVPC
jgi:hypothetical protein